jgi:hypothetical protein
LIGLGVSMIATGLACLGGALYEFTRKEDACGSVWCVNDGFSQRFSGTILSVLATLALTGGTIATFQGGIWYKRSGAALKKLRLTPQVVIDPVTNTYGFSLRGMF